jgi:hypothetical protein
VDATRVAGAVKVVQPGEGRREVVLGPGGYIVNPRGEVRAMWNAGTTWIVHREGPP